MRIQAYTSAELNFAYCYRIYLRCHTRRRQPVIELPHLDMPHIQSLITPYGIRALECNATENELITLVSLNVDESVSSCASKLKGRVSRWLREATGVAGLIGRGYFASTAGAANAHAVEAYLDKQAEHHQYSRRPRPPVLVQQYPLTPAEEGRLQTDHAVTVLQLHVVLSTWRRRGVFTQESAEAVAATWREQQHELRMALTKVSFVPDHVHLTLQLHPVVSPADLVARLMNAAQVVIWNRFDHLAIQAAAERLWQPSAYVGSYGNLASSQVRAYIRRWQRNI